MSRHKIESLARQDVEVYVGWDQPLMTFFGQIYNKAKLGKDDALVLWAGTTHGELYEIDQLARAISQYVIIEPSLRSILYGDKDLGR